MQLSTSNALSQARIGRQLRLLGKRRVRGQDEGGSLGDHLKQELRSDVGQRHVTHFIQHDHVVEHPAGQHSSDRVVLPCFDQFINQNQVRGRGESRPSLFLVGRTN